MSDAPSPETPSAPPAAPTVPARPRAPRRGPTAPAPANTDALPWMPQLLLVAGIVLTAFHLLYGRDDFTLGQRALAVIPLFPLLWEVHRFHKLRRHKQLPFAAYALLMNYVTFS